MLSSMAIQNFKTWESVTVNFGKVTGLFGTNSSGKTSLIQFILLLKQTKEATDRSTILDLNASQVQLGSYRDVVHNHDESEEIRWELSFVTDPPLAIVDPSRQRTRPFIKSDQIRVSGAVGNSPSGIVSRGLSYTLGERQTFSLMPKKNDPNSFDLKAAGSDFRFIRTPGRAWQIAGPLRGYAFPDQARTYFQNASFLSDLEVRYERQVDAVYYLGPLREYPKRDYTWARSRPRDVGVRGEKAIDAILSATLANEMRNLKKKARLKSFQEMIAYWLTEMGLIYDFGVRELAKGSNYWQAFVTIREGGTEALLTDVGFGISQILPVVTLLYYVPEGSTVILEQPEIHLHPLAQSNLADLIIAVAENRGIQVIFESHSEHLLMRLQRRVAEGEIESSEIGLYFADADRNKSKLQDLSLDNLGQIRNWPKDFMGDAFGETVAAERARLKRLKKGEE